MKATYSSTGIYVLAQRSHEKKIFAFCILVVAKEHDQSSCWKGRKLERNYISISLSAHKNNSSLVITHQTSLLLVRLYNKYISLHKYISASTWQKINQN